MPSASRVLPAACAVFAVAVAVAMAVAMGACLFGDRGTSPLPRMPPPPPPPPPPPIPGTLQSIPYWPARAALGVAVPYLTLGSVTFGMALVTAKFFEDIRPALILAGCVALPTVATLFEMAVLGVPRIVRIMGGKPADDRLRAKVTEVATRVSLPVPAHVFEIDTAEKNAFAVGFFDTDRTIAVTSGLRAALTDRELSAVLAHEMGHLLHRDVARNTHIVAVYAGLGGIYEFGKYLWRSGDENTTAFAASLIVAGLGTQVGAHLMRLGLSRSAEFRADAVAAELYGADAFIGALRKIEAGGARRDKLGVRGGALAHMCIAPDPAIAAVERKEAPSTSWFGKWRRLLSTHPSTQERVDALRRLAP